MIEKLQPASVSDPTRLDPFAWIPPKDLTFVELKLRPADIDRPDIWCANYLGDAQLFDLVMEFNGISFFPDLAPGTVIKIPDPVELNTFVQRNRK